MNEPVDEQRPQGAVALSDAIAALRNELIRSVWLSDTVYTIADKEYTLKFTPAPIELTLEVALTVTGKGEAGVKWWVVNASAGGSMDRTSTQTIKLTLNPELVDRATGQQVEIKIDGAEGSDAATQQLQR